MKMVVKQDPVYVRRRRVAATVALVVLVLLVLGLVKGCQAVVALASGKPGPSTGGAAAPASPGAAGGAAASGAPAGSGAKAVDVSTTHLVARTTIRGNITPKSVVASPDGTVYAQNMMYRHTVTTYAPDGRLLATIPDSVDLARFGVPGHPGQTKGAPVEAVFTPDGRKAYVSNYSMYGAGFSHNGFDDCTSKTPVDSSYVYRVDVATAKVDQVINVGAVPKVVALTPDAKTLLATNWCSGTLSIVDTASAKQTATVPIGAHPRGIAVAPDGASAYVAEMGGEQIYRVDLAARTAKPFAKPGKGPRALVLSADGKALFVSDNDSDTVVKLDAGSGATLATARVADQPRSMVRSADGRALYVVSYGARTLTKLATADLAVQQTVRTDAQPIGVTYEPTRGAVWVAAYSGSIAILDERTDGTPAPVGSPAAPAGPAAPGTTGSSAPKAGD